jgi:hypothetical protein
MNARTIHLFPILNGLNAVEELSLHFSEDIDDDENYDEDGEMGYQEQQAGEPVEAPPHPPGLFQPLRVQPHLTVLKLKCVDSYSSSYIRFEQFKQLFASFPNITSMKLEFQSVLSFKELVLA